MPTPDTYSHLTEGELRERLALAEAACILQGWQAAPPSTTAGNAALQAWMKWANHVGNDYLGPSAHPDLNERRIHELDGDRRRIRDETLRRIEDDQ